MTKEEILWLKPQPEKETFKQRFVLEAMDEYAKHQCIEILNWLSSEKSPYAILYGNQAERFATNEADFTSQQIVDIYLESKQNKL